MKLDMMLALAALSGCTAGEAANRKEAIQPIEPWSFTAFARLLPDRSIEVQSRRSNRRAIAEGFVILKVDDPRYSEIKARLGEIKPGEQQVVSSWIEPYLRSLGK